MFKNQTIVIATMHGKEKVIAPLFKEQFNANCILPTKIDTDQLGTFSGEIELKLSPLESAKAKCKIAIEQSNAKIAIASEGSFGPHPSLFFLNADFELVYLMDTINNIEISATVISTNTNFDEAKISSLLELDEFLNRCQFPSHKVILKTKNEIIKNISNYNSLKKAFLKAVEKEEVVTISTDMRAMHNPTRMKVIEEATEKLIAKLNQLCPKCNYPGFEVKSSESGLPCEDCGFPTKSALKHIFLCDKCNHSEIVLFPNGKKFEEAMYCDQCNP